MKKVYHCDLCDTSIDTKRLQGIVHIRCPKCLTRYQMTQQSVKKHAVIPLLSIVLALYLSNHFVPANQLIWKLGVIIIVSSASIYLCNLMMLHRHIYEYEIMKSEAHHEK